MNDLVRSILNPFDTTTVQPKWPDGTISRTSGLRLKSTGSINCNTNGYTYIVVHPGLSNTISYYGPTNNWLSPGPYTGFLSGTGAENYDTLLNWRNLTAGAKFSVENAMDALDGTWEAIRYVPKSNFIESLPAWSFLREIPFTDVQDACVDMINENSYQQGRLRDLHRFLFRLNFRKNEIPFISPTHTQGATSQWLRLDVHDAIIIRIKGRQVVGEPTVLNFQTASLFEVEYNRRTAVALHRLMLENKVVSDIDELPIRMNYKTPGFQIN